MALLTFSVKTYLPKLYKSNTRLISIGCIGWGGIPIMIRWYKGHTMWRNHLANMFSVVLFLVIQNRSVFLWFKIRIFFAFTIQCIEILTRSILFDVPSISGCAANRPNFPVLMNPGPGPAWKQFDCQDILLVAWTRRKAPEPCKTNLKKVTPRTNQWAHHFLLGVFIMVETCFNFNC